MSKDDEQRASAMQEELNKLIADQFGMRLTVKSTDNYGDLRIYARVPVNACIILTGEALMSASLAARADMLADTMYRLQEDLFTQVTKHIEAHDKNGRVENIKRVAMQAVDMARKYIPIGAWESDEFQHVLEYLKEQ